jgi:hypothetical protein
MPKSKTVAAHASATAASMAVTFRSTRRCVADAHQGVVALGAGAGAVAFVAFVAFASSPSSSGGAAVLEVASSMGGRPRSLRSRSRRFFMRVSASSPSSSLHHMSAAGQSQVIAP